MGLKYLSAIPALLLATSVSAAVIDIEYKFDGTSLVSTNGVELFGTEMAVGDTLNLKYTAVGSNSYWDFSSVGSEGNVNLGFEYPDSCGTRSSHGSYNASLNGSSLLAENYSSAGQSCIHLGPENIDFSSVSIIDEFSISYSLDSSSAANDIVGSYSDSTWWQVWELFNGSITPFYYEADVAIPEPGSIALILLGLAGFGFSRKRKS